MPEPIMKKYKHGETGQEYGMPSKEKPQSSMMKKYNHGELSDAGSKKPNEKVASFAKKMYKQGELGQKVLPMAGEDEIVALGEDVEDDLDQEMEIEDGT